MSGAQRAFWIDLLALAGRSRYPGVICSGCDNGKFIGYPLSVFTSLDAAGELDIKATFELFVSTRKIDVEVTSEKPFFLYKVSIINWEHYQSETSRKQKQRQSSKIVPRHVPPNDSNDVPYLSRDMSRQMSHTMSKECPATEVEVEGDIEVEGDKGGPPQPLFYEGAHLKITSKQADKLCEAYSDLGSLVPFYREMDAYLDTHPEKEYKNLYAFARNWLSREKEKRGSGAPAPRRTDAAVGTGPDAAAVGAKVKPAALERIRKRDEVQKS